MAEQRIQKVLSDQGVCSRRAAEKLIDEGRVKVNGHPVTLGDKMDPDFDKVSIDGKSVRIVRKRQYTYLMLNKPRGYITTASDERGRKTVMDLLAGVDRRVYPIGRLDKDSEGLLLLTAHLPTCSLILLAVWASCTALLCAPARPRNRLSKCPAALCWTMV